MIAATTQFLFCNDVKTMSLILHDCSSNTALFINLDIILFKFTAKKKRNTHITIDYGNLPNASKILLSHPSLMSKVENCCADVKTH